MADLDISSRLSLPEQEIELSAIRAQGAGGQNVNKVSTAIHLRFDIATSSLPEVYKQALLDRRDRRISSEGIVVIKAQRYRSQEKNREDALARLAELIRQSMAKPKARQATRPSRAARARRTDDKTRRGKTKANRRPVQV